MVLDLVALVSDHHLWLPVEQPGEQVGYRVVIRHDESGFWQDSFRQLPIAQVCGWQAADSCLLHPYRGYGFRTYDQHPIELETSDLSTDRPCLTEPGLVEYRLGCFEGPIHKLLLMRPQALTQGLILHFHFIGTNEPCQYSTS